MKKLKVGFFLHFDFTVNGMLFNELSCYNEIFNHPNIEKIYIYDYKGKFSWMCKDFNFDYTRVIVSSFEDAEKFTKVDYIFTWDWYQDFFGGVISKKAVDLYKLMSRVTNELDQKVYFRICDSRHYMRDYKKMIQDRISDDENGRKFVARNPELLHALDDIPRMNYDNVFFLCNGSRKVEDWSWVTLTFSMDFLKKEDVQKRTVYLSDDVLFRYNECFEKMKDLSIENKIDMLYHVGNLNAGKLRKLKAIYKKEECDLPLFLRTAPRTLNTSVKKLKYVTMLEEPIYKEEMFRELNKYFAYFFIGKGDENSYYFNKTLYDASIARTIFLIYGKIDTNGIYRELSDYVFNDTQELKEKYEWLKTVDYQKHLDYQREVLLRNLSDESLKIFECLDI